MLASDKKYQLNRMNANAIKNLLGSEIHHTKNIKLGTYDFTVQGGATGEINLLDSDGNNVVLPSGAIVTRTFVHVVTAATSGGSATIAVKMAGAADGLAATAVASFTTDALIDGKAVNTAATSILLSADKNPTLTVAVAALTAGKIQVFFEYMLTTGV